MKKLLLLFILFFSTSVLVAQNFNQPTQFNNMCDDNNDGIASFYLAEITFEILGNLNSQDYVVTHHETLADAQAGVNPLSSPYANIVPNQQKIFVRIVTVATNAVTIVDYDLFVNPTPEAPTVTVTNCADVTTSFPCWDLASVETWISQGMTGLVVTYYTTQFDAQAQTNQIANPSCYISPTASPNQPPVFYRVTNQVTGCSSVGMVELVTIVCENPSCPSPTQLAATNITTTSAVLSWLSSGTEMSWIVNVIADGGPAMAYYVNQNPFVLNDLFCDSTYSFSVTADCGDGGTSVNPEWSTFWTPACNPQAGEATNVTTCSDTADFGCFNMSINDYYIIGSLNPVEYTITYHLSQADADNDVAAIANPSNYCAQHGQIIYARLENIANPTLFQTFPFALVVQTFSNEVMSLNDLIQCDDNNDTVVTFDLTTIEAQLNSGNTVVYYPSLSNAQNQVVPFANPSALNIGIQNPITSVFAREIIPNGCDVIYTFDLYAYANCNLAYTCQQANSLCNSLGIPFANTINNNGNGSASCLATTPNPTWFYLPISGAGSINLQISQTSNNGFPLDVDYIVYGPFTDPVSPCGNQGQLLSNVVSCSYSAAAVEYPFIPNAQPGQFYLIMVTNYANQPGLITITEQSSTVGAIDCSGLRLNAFLDANNNGTQDSGEQNFPLGQFTFEVNNNGNVHNIIAPSGVYNIYDNNASNSYDLSYALDPNYAAMYNVSTASYSNVNVVVGAGMQVYNFPVTVVQSYNDLAVTIIPINAPRPGFSYQNKIVYTNFGNQTIAAGTVTFTKDPLVTITANTQSGTTPTATGFTYNFTNLLPFETREMIVTMQVPVLPTVAIGDLLTNTATIVPLSGDVVPANNTSSCSQMVIGAYDPNDKMESHGERILHSSFTANDYLYYTIRFENTGNASAINVRINDVLDARLDETSIRMISASHAYTMDRLNKNINWYFNNIMLPPSVADTNTGKGYVTFQVKPLPGYAVGDIIPNTASIYFDFNPAIVTNTFNTQFVAQLGLDDFENADFVFYPNPVTDMVTVTVKNSSTIANVNVYDILGKMVVSQKPATALATQAIDLSALSKGVYLLEVTTASNLKVIKKLIVE